MPFYEFTGLMKGLNLSEELKSGMYGAIVGYLALGVAATLFLVL